MRAVATATDLSIYLWRLRISEAFAIDSGLASCRFGGGWKWTEWDLNPRLPPCEGGDLPLIYRPSRTMTNPGARNRFRCSCSCDRRDGLDSAGKGLNSAAPLAALATSWSFGCTTPPPGRRAPLHPPPPASSRRKWAAPPPHTTTPPAP